MNKTPSETLMGFCYEVQKDPNLWHNHAQDLPEIILLLHIHVYIYIRSLKQQDVMNYIWFVYWMW